MAATMASPIAHTKSIDGQGRRRGQVEWRERVCGRAEPERLPSPRNTSDPIPAATRPGSRTSGSVGPPSPAASMMITAPMIGLPKIVEIAAKLPAAPSRAAPGPARPAGAGHREHAERAAERDERRLRPETIPSPMPATAASKHAGQIGRCRGRAPRQASGGPVPALARQPDDRDPHEQARQREKWHRPPRRAVANPRSSGGRRRPTAGSRAVSSRKTQPAMETTIPTTAASTSSPRYPRDRMRAPGSVRLGSAGHGNLRVCTTRGPAPRRSIAGIAPYRPRPRAPSAATAVHSRDLWPAFARSRVSKAYIVHS